MAVITQDLLAGMLTNFRALFQNDFLAASQAQAWQSMVVPMDSNGANNVYTWFGTVPKMENVTHGQASRNGLPKYSFQINNDEFQALLEVERAAIERDQLNIITPRIGQMALEAARYPGELAWLLFEQNPLAFDGVAFVADTRTIGASGNIDNNLAGTGITVAQFQTDLGVARGVMRQFKDDIGRPMNLIGNIIVIPPQLEQVVYQALNANQGNILNPVLPSTLNGNWSFNGYSVMVNPFLTDATDWYLLHSDGIDKPFIWQTEVAPRMDADTNPNSTPVIESRKFLYSAYARGNVGVTDPRFIVKTVNAG